MTDAADQARHRTARMTVVAHGRRRRASPARPRSWLTWTAGALSLTLSFVITLQLTKPTQPPSAAVAAMTKSLVSDRRTLIAAIKAAGLTGSQNVKGAIDEIAKLDDRRAS